MKVKEDEKEKYEQFWKINTYVAGSYTERRDFEMLNQEMGKNDSQSNANRLFYLALPPSVFETVTVNIRNTCMALQSVSLI
jgi:glucose-6-phosphate 1-dehydrogenase